MQLQGTGCRRNRGRNDSRRLLELKPSGRVVRNYESSFVRKAMRDCDQAVQASRCGVCRCKAELGSCLDQKG
jgi:hypothetical protein